MKNPTKNLPEQKTILRAAIFVIPTVGGALDHLIFDKADEIRIRNIELALKALSDQIDDLGDDINQDWFSSNEALAAFKLLAEKVSYEPDSKKIQSLGKLVASYGSFKQVANPKKLTLLNHISQLSYVQIRILGAINKTIPNKKEIKSGDIKQSVTTIWTPDIIKTLKSGQIFWKGELKLTEELDILEAYNFIRRTQLFNAPEASYSLTSLGSLAIKDLLIAESNI